jgi:hypothetical protein
MGRIFDAVQQLLAAENMRFEVAQGATALRFGFRTEKHSWTCVVEVREQQDFLIFASMLPEAVAEAQRPAVAELLTRINSGLAVGGFEMDWDAGAVRFRTSVDLEGTEPGAPLMRQLLRANLSTTARFYQPILEVAASEKSPVEALAAMA